MTIRTTINREDVDIYVKITVEPDYRASFGVESAVDANGVEYDLTATEESSAIEQAFSERQPDQP